MQTMINEAPVRQTLDRGELLGALRAFQRGRPDAFEQISHLLQLPGDLGDQLLTSRAEVP
jgi:hypothetical protein